MLQSGFGKHLFEADVFLCREFEIISVNFWIRSRRASGSFSLFHHFEDCMAVSRLGSDTRPRRASVFVCRKTFRHTKTQLATLWRG